MSPPPSSLRMIGPSLALLCACTRGGPPPETAPVAPPSVTADPTPPQTREPTPVPAPSPLHVVARREGAIDLRTTNGHAAVVLEGELLPIVDGVPTRGPSGGRGLPQLGDEDGRGSTLAVAGSLAASGTAWTSIEEQFDRAGSEYWVHRNRGEGWERVDLRKGLLVAYDVGYVEREGALLGLRAWARDPRQDHYEPEDDGPRARAYRRALERALAKAQPHFVHLGGPKIAVPELPADVEPFAAASTDDGSIHALAYTQQDDTTVAVLLAWPPGATRAELVPLPPFADSQPRLWSDGAQAIVTGVVEASEGTSPRYLAVGRGTQWERIPVDLPPLSDDAPTAITGAARLDDGEVWIAIGDPWTESTPDPVVWRRPAGGTWQPVPLPAFDDALFGRDPAVVYEVTGMGDEAWTDVRRGPQTLQGLRATALVRDGGVVWVALELDAAFEEDSSSTPRAVLLTTGPAPAQPMVLPSRSEAYVERHDALLRDPIPGEGSCQRFSLVLGPAERPELAAPLSTLELEGSADVSRTYVGELDGRSVVVATGHAYGAGDAKRLREQVAAASGTSPTVECRIPRHVRTLWAR